MTNAAFITRKKGQCLHVELIAERRVGETFAYYVMRGDEKIHVRWYSEDDHFCYDTAGEAGVYSLRCFRKLGEEVGASEASARFSMPGRAMPAEVLFQNSEATGLRLTQYRGHELPTYHLTCGDEAILFVLLSSAVRREMVTLPVFHRIGRAREGLYPGEVMCVADPTLELDEAFAISWYMGLPEADLQGDLADFIVEFAQSRGISRNRIVLWGSSSGGFSALALAARIGTAIAVAINPQTIAMEYELQTELVRTICLDGLDDEAIRRRFGSRAHMPDTWAGRSDLCAIIVQNTLDEHHYEKHFKPLWAAMGGELELGWSTAAGSLALLYEHPDGHIAETVPMTEEIIDRIRTILGECS